MHRPFRDGSAVFVRLKAAGAVGLCLVLIAGGMSCRKDTAGSPAGVSPNTTAALPLATGDGEVGPKPPVGSDDPVASDNTDPLAGMDPELLAQLAEAEAAAAAEERHGACGTCHIDTADEFDGSLHQTEDTGCVDCHGPSKGHVEDENNDVKPDEVFARPDVDRLCEKCHECSRPSPVRPAPKLRKKRKVCTDCHGSHKLRLTDNPPDTRRD